MGKDLVVSRSFCAAIVVMAITFGPVGSARAQGVTCIQGSIEYCNSDETCCGGTYYFGCGGHSYEDQKRVALSAYYSNCNHFNVHPQDLWGTIGSASLDTNLVGTGFGSSGNDGVRVSLLSVSGLITQWRTLLPTQSGPDSAHIEISADGVRGGMPQNLGFVRYYDAGGDHFGLDADFSPAGAAYSRVDCYLLGSVVASGPAQINGSFGDVFPGGGWPRRASIDCGSAGAPTSMGIGLGWEAQIAFRIHGDAFPTNCDSVRITAVNPAIMDGSMSTATFRLKNIDTLAVTGVVIRMAPLEATADVSDPSVGGGGLLLSQNTPNPFRGQSTIRFVLPEPGQVTLRLYDLQGRPVSTPYAAVLLTAGQHEARIESRDLHAGVYWYRLEAGGKTLERRMIVLN